VRRRKADLRARVNGQLTLRYERAGLTSYAGLEFVRRWLHRDGVVALLRQELATALPATDYGVLGLVLVVLALLLSGGRRLRHLRYLDRDPVVLRFCGLRQLPTARTVGRWLAAFRAQHLPRLQRVNALVAARVIRQSGQRRLTIDVDGSVVSTGLQVAWAQRGFNPHRRKVPSYYPITAYEAQSGQILRVQNRRETFTTARRRCRSCAHCSISSGPRSGPRTRSNSAWMARISAARSWRSSRGPAPSTRSRSPSIRGSGSRTACGARARGRG
jgi:hypothetical protein